MSEVPKEWVIAKLQSLADFVMGQAPPGADCNKSGAGTPFVKAGEFGPIAPLIREWTTRPLKHALASDVLICVVGATAGKINMGANCAIGRSVAAIRPTSGVDQRYLYEFLSTRVLDLRANSAGSAQGVISKDDLAAIELPLAPVLEQRRIVAKIDSLTAKSKSARDHLNHIPRLVEKYKQAVLAAAFRGDLTRDWRSENPDIKWTKPEINTLNERRKSYLSSRRGSRLHSNIEKKFDLPQEWFLAQLSDIGNLQVGYAYKSKWYASEGVRLLRGTNIAPGSVTWDDEAKLPRDLAAEYSDYLVEEGNIVIAMDRPIISTGLKVARINPEDAGCLLVQRVARYSPLDLVDDDYVWHLINSQHFIDYAVTQATGSDLPHISSNDILSTPVPLPCLPEQREIARRIGRALSWIDRLAAEAASARRLVDRLDQAVLAKAFRGELVPQDPVDEPASVLLERIRAERGDTPKARRGRKAKVDA